MAKEKATQKSSVRANQGGPLYDTIYTIDTAAAALNCSARTLGDKFREGEIRAYKRLGQWYTLHSDLVAFLRE